MVWDVENKAGRERYFVNPTKSHTLNTLQIPGKTVQRIYIYMYGEKVKNRKSATHLGIVRNVNRKPEIGEKISLGKKNGLFSYGCWVAWGWGVESITEWAYLVNFYRSEVALRVRGYIAQKKRILTISKGFKGNV